MRILMKKWIVILVITITMSVTPLSAHAALISSFLFESVDNYDLTWSLNSYPAEMENFLTDGATGFTLLNVLFSDSLNGDANSFIAFYNIDNGGGFTIGSLFGRDTLSAYVPQLFSGALDAPMFIDGVYSLYAGLGSTDGVVGMLTIRTVDSNQQPGASVTEPPILAIFAFGVILLGWLRRIDKFHP